jgi:5-formyltetrahydrofolate cyclo-ligase
LFDSRPSLRKQLLADRTAFVATAAGKQALEALAGHLCAVLRELEPQCLGLYWAIRSEFNASAACAADAECSQFPLALPYVQRELRQMHFRHWDGATPRAVDEARIPASDGTPVVPDVLVVPCVGYTAAGYRLGYGGGYFDRYIEAHPHVTTVGIALSPTELGPVQFTPEPHDRPLTLIISERGPS